MIDKNTIASHFDAHAEERPYWFKRNQIYHQQVIRACKPFLNPDSRVLELGCGTGDLLNALNPHIGVGVDISKHSIEVANNHYPNFEWICADVENLPEQAPFDQPFDIIILSDLVGYLGDIQNTFERLKGLTHSGTRIIISHWNWMWKGVIGLGERLHLKHRDLKVLHNWLSPSVLDVFLRLAGYETIQTISGLLLPFSIPVVTPLINVFSHAPILDHVTLLRIVVGRPAPKLLPAQHTSVTVVIPTRNEVGNIEAAIQRTPQMGTSTELLFIDGNSTDGTIEKILEAIKNHPERNIRFMPQVQASESTDEKPNLMLKLGKGDAVRKAFDAASGEIVMILDSDLTVPPEVLPKFYEALVTNKARFINGSRLVYEQEAGAMPWLNRIGNTFFSLLFSWLLGQQITDTLCGTKALYKKDYQAIKANRSYFGDFDPFGDFDLLFGAAWLKLPIIDLPLRYMARTFGDSKVRVGLHGPLLIKMSAIAFWQFKLRPLLTKLQGGTKPEPKNVEVV
jgi:glycosyltransferase involved in cell wall biosynthesis/SAM-dependent methyltransferase